MPPPAVHFRSACIGYAARSAAGRAWLDKCDCYVRYVWRLAVSATARTDRISVGPFEFGAVAVRSILGSRQWPGSEPAEVPSLDPRLVKLELGRWIA